MATTGKNGWVKVVVIAMWGVIVGLIGITYANLTSDIDDLIRKLERVDARLDTINNEVRIGTQWITVLQDKVSDQEQRLRQLERWMAKMNGEP